MAYGSSSYGSEEYSGILKSNSYGVSLSDSIGSSDSISKGPGKSLSDSIGSSDSKTESDTRAFLDALSSFDISSYKKNKNLYFMEMIRTSDSILNRVFPKGNFFEYLSSSDSIVLAKHFGRPYIDMISFTDYVFFLKQNPWVSGTTGPDSWSGRSVGSDSWTNTTVGGSSWVNQ